MRTKTAQVLIVEDDLALQRQIKWALDRFDVHTAHDRESAVAVFRRARPAVVTMDLGLPPDADGVTEGMQLLAQLLDMDPQVKIIVLTGQSDRANAHRAVELGAFDFMVKPLEADVLTLAIEHALRMHELQAELSTLRALVPHGPLDGLVTRDDAMLALCRMIEKVAPSDATVALLGESGTGKEVLASGLHRASRRQGRFVAINCSAIPENLLESELFGYEKGAFTGAYRTTQGRIETAHGGTLFLDEIGDLPLALQAKLLRFLQERTVDRLGGRQAIPVDVRVVCATHQDLKGLIQAGTFREDLFYRIAEVVIDIPPLRDRRGDAVLLATTFLQRHAKESGKALRFNDAALRALEAHAWPGNVRELQNMVKRASILSDGPVVRAEDLGLQGTSLPDDSNDLDLDLRTIRDHAERTAVAAALQRSQGNVAKAATLLGVTRPTLYDLMSRHHLVAER